VEPEISEADLLCYAQRYGNLFNVYCQGDVATCDYPGLLHHYDNWGKTGGKRVGCDAATDAPVEPEISEADLVCYAQRYGNLLKVYCQGDVATCDYPGLLHHYDNVGKSGGKRVGCDAATDAPVEPVEPEISEADLICYAQRYGNLFNVYCLGDVATCNYAGLLHHYENHGRSGGKRVGCDPVAETTEDPMVGYTKVGDGFCRGPGGSTVNFVKSDGSTSLADCVSMCNSLSTCVGLSHMGKDGGYCEAYGSMTSAPTGWAYRNKVEKTVVSSGSHHGVVCYTKDGSEAVGTPEPTEPALTRENYICYALRYPHLLNAYCQGSATTCFVDGLKHHFENHGQGNGLSTDCTPEFLAIINGN